MPPIIRVTNSGSSSGGWAMDLYIVHCMERFGKYGLIWLRSVAFRRSSCKASEMGQSQSWEMST